MRFFKREKISDEERRYIAFTAYETLLEFGERSLPVLSDFCRIVNSSIFIFPMQFIARKEGLTDGYFSHAGSGMALYADTTGHYIILYDEDLAPSGIRWTIARLLYLIKSGRLLETPNVFHFSDDCADSEKCDAFAYHFTCPDYILNECNISSASDIIKYCEIPFSFADKKSRLLKTSRGMPSMPAISEALDTRFRSYIERMKKDLSV